MFRSYVGSYPYMAPEITGDQEYGSEVDIFALGLLFYAVFKNTVLTNSFGQRSLIPGIYIEKNRIAYLNEVMKREETNQEEFLDKYYKESSSFGKFLFSMLHIERSNRPDMDSVLAHVTNEFNPVIQRQRHQEESIKDLQKQKDDLRSELHQLRENSERDRLVFRKQRQEMDRIIKHKNDTISGLQKEVTRITGMLEKNRKM